MVEKWERFCNARRIPSRTKVEVVLEDVDRWYVLIVAVFVQMDFVRISCVEDVSLLCGKNVIGTRAISL